MMVLAIGLHISPPDSESGISPIMVVMAVIAIVVAIATPTWLRQRELSRGRACQENLLKINGAKEQYALEFKVVNGSAVDMDEEAANLITYQRGYQASAHFISVINDLTSQLLTQLGA